MEFWKSKISLCKALLAASFMSLQIAAHATDYIRRMETDARVHSIGRQKAFGQAALGAGLAACGLNALRRGRTSQYSAKFFEGHPQLYRNYTAYAPRGILRTSAGLGLGGQALFGNYKFKVYSDPSGHVRPGGFMRGKQRPGETLWRMRGSGLYSRQNPPLYKVLDRKQLL